MAKYLIEWGYDDGFLLADVIEAESLNAASMEAEHMANDWWESNKIATAKPFEDKHEQLSCGDISSGGGVPELHAAGRGSGDGQVT